MKLAENTLSTGITPHHSRNDVSLGKITDVSDSGVPMVSFCGCVPPEGVCARTTVAVSKKDVGAEVAVSFLDGDIAKPLVTGRIQDVFLDQTPVPDQDSSHQIEIDSERISFVADREIVLRCGKASITLTKAGRVIVSGTYVLNKATGVNKIRGGSVQIN